MAISTEEKLDIINRLSNGERLANTCCAFGLTNSISNAEELVLSQELN
jgi:hypothetical protein